MQSFRFPSHNLPPETVALRREVREFLKREMPGVSLELRANSWSAADREFSRKLGKAGYIGMTWPKKYGGREKSALERYVVIEELLAAGAPVGAHWIGDRQSGPLLLRHGTEAQRERFLPAIARGECFFSIGMSEPDSGSDLASVRTKATKTKGGWSVRGRKLWTSLAHENDYMIALLRTGKGPEERHLGLTQFLIDLRAPGLTINRVHSLAGSAHGFNEVVFEDVFVPDDMLVGREGNGWAQVMTELAYERSGPERFMSSYPLLSAALGEMGAAPSDSEAVELGLMTAELMALRAMSVSVNFRLAQGDDPVLEASLTKDLGNVFEQSIPERLHALRPVEPGSASDYAQMLDIVTRGAPSFSLRGGTREILRGIIARGLGLR